MEEISYIKENPERISSHKYGIRGFWGKINTPAMPARKNSLIGMLIYRLCACICTTAEQ